MGFKKEFRARINRDIDNLENADYAYIFYNIGEPDIYISKYPEHESVWDYMAVVGPSLAYQETTNILNIVYKNILMPEIKRVAIQMFLDKLNNYEDKNQLNIKINSVYDKFIAKFAFKDLRQNLNSKKIKISCIYPDRFFRHYGQISITYCNEKQQCPGRNNNIYIVKNIPEVIDKKLKTLLMWGPDSAIEDNISFIEHSPRYEGSRKTILYKYFKKELYKGV